MSEFRWFSAAELNRKYLSKELSPVEVTVGLLGDIADLNPGINAFSLVDPEGALSEAQASERRYQAGTQLSALDGVPIVLKDLFLSKRWPNRCGSLLTEDVSDQEDAPVYISLAQAGAVFLGRTTTPEFGWKGVTDSPLTGITRNPWNLHLTSGGSSGGTAAAVAAGMSPMGVGTDGGGSIRIPASFCGLVGFKPTFGLVPQYPMSALGSLVHTGPIARTVEDCALMLDNMTAPDSRDCSAIMPPNFRFADIVRQKKDIAHMRIAYSPNLGYGSNNPAVQLAVEKTVAILEELGAHVDTIDIPLGNPGWAVQIMWFTGVGSTIRKVVKNYSARNNGSDPYPLIDPGLLAIAEKYQDYAATDYADALDERYRWGEYMSILLSHYDALVLPTMPITAFPAGQDNPDEFPQTAAFIDAYDKIDHGNSIWSPYAYPFNFTGQPALSLPCGFADNMPVGLQIIGKRHADDIVLHVARAAEEAIAWQGLAGQNT